MVSRRHSGSGQARGLGTKLPGSLRSGEITWLAFRFSRELLHHLPGQQLRVVGGLRRQVAQHRPERLAAEGAREGKPAVAADAMMPGQLKLKPAGHPLALHQDGLRLQRGPEWPADALGQGLRQVLQPVAGV